MLANWKLVVVGLVAALVCAAAGAFLMYEHKTSPPEATINWTAAGNQLAHIIGPQLQQHQDSQLRLMADSLRDAVLRTGSGQQHLALSSVDSSRVDSLLSLLGHTAIVPATPADSLQILPIVVSTQKDQIGELRAASTTFQSVIGSLTRANDALMLMHQDDTTFRHRMLTHWDSQPKPPRGTVWTFLTHPSPYTKLEYSTQQKGLDGRVGICLGCRTGSP